MKSKGYKINLAAMRLSEPPDHAAVELEFMSVLCGQEVEAWRGQMLRVAVERLQAEEHFLTTHLCPWFPEFARLVMARADGGFYSLATGAIAGFLHHDRELVIALLDRYRSEVICVA